MNKQFKKRRVVPVAVALLAAVVISGVAYAYWTASGTGGGTGRTAAGVSSLTADSAALADMYPGKAAQNIVITVRNPSAQTVYVTQVAVAVGDSTPSGCGAANFTVTGSPATVHAEIAASGSLLLTAPYPTIQFFDDPDHNQDVCKNVQVNLIFTIS